MTATTKLYTKFYGKRVGEDAFGNVYYTQKKTPKNGKAKRWVIYNGTPEPSKVPAQWHGWLHYTLDNPTSGPTHEWEKEHIPNLTGTVNAYLPSGHLHKGGKRESSTSDYQAWKP